MVRAGGWDFSPYSWRLKMHLQGQDLESQSITLSTKTRSSSASSNSEEWGLHLPQIPLFFDIFLRKRFCRNQDMILAILQKSEKDKTS